MKTSQLWYVWLVVVIAGTLAVVMSTTHRMQSAVYRAIPSADVRQLSADYPLTRADRDAELTRIVEREWRRINGGGQ